MQKANRKLLVFGAVVSFMVTPALMAAEPPPRVQDMKEFRAKDGIIVQRVSDIMHNQHLSKHGLDDEISKRAFDQFFKALDPFKLYFYQSDIDGFMKNHTTLDDDAKKGKGEFPIRVFKTFLERVDERVKMAHEEIDREHDFTIDEKLPADRDVVEYPKTPEEARDRMRKQIKYSMLLLKNEKVAEGDEVAKKKSQEDPRARLHRRYDSILKRQHQTDADEVLETFVTAITTSFDPHTTYMAPKTLTNFDIVMSLKLEGIGAQLTLEDGFTTITNVVPGGAAAKDGRLKSGDRIVSVGQGVDGDMVDVLDMKLDDVVSKIRGNAGTTVRLGVKPAAGGEVIIYNIVRAKINLEDSAARSEVVEHGKKADGSAFKVGYIDLPSFYLDMKGAKGKSDSYRSSTRDVRNILTTFRESNVDAVVVDLSRNGGGSLTEAISLTGLFIDHGPVVQVKDPSGEVQVYDDEDSGAAWNGPLVVMTSKESASASEIFAGAIKDYRRGIVVGDPSTHGKGTVQSLVDLGQLLLNRPNEYGALKITIQQFYLPAGKSTQREGVLSDIILPAITSAMDISEADLDYALPSDEVRKAGHQDYGLVNNEVLSKLRNRSTSRVKSSEGFDKLLKRIELYRSQKDEKYVSLNEQAFLERRKEIDAEKEDEKAILDAQLPKKEVFKKDFYAEEVLNITTDYVEAVNSLDLAANAKKVDKS
ncbi:MAG: carboxy terminal-processing peptidase [Pirellulaceae bacterium]|nr:carboxy terminal-processing peptidase [Pirellulaceae bacterium]